MWIPCLHNHGNLVAFCKNTHKFGIYKVSDDFLCKSKNPQKFSPKNVENSVDNVDNLLTKEIFSHFYDVSGTHSYQQITLNTFF